MFILNLSYNNLKREHSVKEKQNNKAALVYFDYIHSNSDESQGVEFCLKKNVVQGLFLKVEKGTVLEDHEEGIFQILSKKKVYDLKNLFLIKRNNKKSIKLGEKVLESFYSIFIRKL